MRHGALNSWRLAWFTFARCPDVNGHSDAPVGLPRPTVRIIGVDRCEAFVTAVEDTTIRGPAQDKNGGFAKIFLRAVAGLASRPPVEGFVTKNSPKWPTVEIRGSKIFPAIPTLKSQFGPLSSKADTLALVAVVISDSRNVGVQIDMGCNVMGRLGPSDL